MRKLFIVGSLAVLWSCAEDLEEAETLSLSYYDNSRLSQDYPYVSDGDRIVLHRYFVAQDHPNIADDEYSEDFLLELPGDLDDSFVLSGEALQDLYVLYNQYCFCSSGDVFNITGGEIKGTPAGRGWFIEVDLDYEQGYVNPEDEKVVIVDVDSISFSGVFMPRTRPGSGG